MVISLWLDKTLEYSYVIMCPQWKEATGALDPQGVWQNISQYDLLQKAGSDYVFLFAPFTAIPNIMSMYQESCYDLRAVVPWIKTPVRELPGIFVHKQRFKTSIEYCFIFQHSNVLSLRTPYSDAICEPVGTDTNCPDSWVSQIVQDMTATGLNGLVVYRDSYKDSSEFEKLSRDNHKVVLF